MRGLDNRIVANPNVFSNMNAPPPINPDPRWRRTWHNAGEELQNSVSQTTKRSFGHSHDSTTIITSNVAKFLTQMGLSNIPVQQVREESNSNLTARHAWIGLP
jgi:hypothetical protein